MKRIAGTAAAWTAATLLAVTVAAAAVGSVRSDVTNAPTVLGAPAVQAIDGDSPDVVLDAGGPVGPDTPTSTSSIVVPIDEPSEAATPAEVVEANASTTTTLPHDHESNASTTSTTTTTAVPDTTTTTTTYPSYTKTYDVEDAGSVTIRVSGDSVTFAGAWLQKGWTFKLKDGGPEQVEVRFENNDDDKEQIVFKAKIEAGELKVSTSESD